MGAITQVRVIVAVTIASFGIGGRASAQTPPNPVPDLSPFVGQRIEVTDGASVQQLADRLAGRRIDVLINNAGIYRHDHLGELDFERIRQQFETNTLGPLRVTQALLPLLHEGSKVAIITSRSGTTPIATMAWVMTPVPGPSSRTGPCRTGSICAAMARASAGLEGAMAPTLRGRASAPRKNRNSS